MRKVISGFATIAIIVAMMLNFGPPAIRAVGDKMFDTFYMMTDSVMPSDGSAPNADFADKTINELDEASQIALGELDTLSRTVLDQAENVENFEEDEEGGWAFVDKTINDGAAVVWGFISKIAG